MNRETEIKIGQIASKILSDNPVVTGIQSNFDVSAGDTTFDTIDTIEFEKACIDILTDTLSAADATIGVEGSVDGTNFLLLSLNGSDAEVVLDTTTGLNRLIMTEMPTRYIRFVFTANAVVTGTLTITPYFKKK